MNMYRGYCRWQQCLTVVKDHFWKSLKALFLCFYWVLFPIDFETGNRNCKRILTKEKLDSQEAEQNTGAPLF